MTWTVTHNWSHRLQPILEAGRKKALPERQINSVQAFIERFPGVERVVMDGTSVADATTH
ncbi:hypothetical protein [Okeania sp.]|uniref:hypothetical protein n=1 Tax=Okeania sp. TaxID=3100323 RepID=UPI002B4B68C6|nr:hypothetical protein [Okeania sp.]MEB3339419.1 hypothetical protein [Okeania sp.]